MSFIDYLHSTKRDPKNSFIQSQIELMQSSIDQLNSVNSSEVTVQNMVSQQIHDTQKILNILNTRLDNNDSHYGFTGAHETSLEDIDTRFSQTYRDNMVEYLESNNRAKVEEFLYCYDVCTTDNDKELMVRGQLGLGLTGF